MTAWLENHLLPCAFKSLFGIDCPICGFQRSFLLLFQGRFLDSFKMYPPLIPCLLFLLITGIYCINKNLVKPRVLKLSSVSILSIIFLSYFVKMSLLIFFLIIPYKLTQSFQPHPFMKIFNQFFLSGIISIALFSGCTKQGDTGPAGTDGINGANGNANVKPTSDSTNSTSNWTFIPGSYWITNFVNPELSTSFINSGGYAQVFFSYDNGRVWYSLPTTYSADSTLSAQMSYSYSLNNVEIYFAWSDARQHTDPVTTYGSTCLYKVICVAPSAIKKH